MKRISAIILAICLLFACAASAMAASPPETEMEAKPLLSEMEEDQCMEILSDLGVTIPEEKKDFDIKKMLKVIEANPDATYVISDTIGAKLFNDVQSAVQKYYEPSPRYALQNSTLYSWNAATMPGYNCYAYAVGITFSCDPGYFSRRSYDDTTDIGTFASIVKADLQDGLGQSCVKVQGNRPSSIGSWSNVIAVRRDTNCDIGFNDYHFAKLSSGSWYHKPGPTAVLKFNSAPSNSIIWTNEAYNGVYRAPTIWYESNIMYLLYKTAHGNTTYTWTGQHYHSGSKHFYQYGYLCSDCGEYTNTVWTSVSCSGPPCATPWSLTPTPEVS